jgi:four helix bundle protein
MKFNLEERTSNFSKNLILFSKKIKKEVISLPLIDQLIRSGTSVGANYMEANEAISKKDFLYRISICRKEAKETKYWLRNIVIFQTILKDEAEKLYNEAHELILIFSSIINKKK